MSTPKFISTSLTALLLATPWLADAAENLLAPASFESIAPGMEPGEPWKTRAKSADTAIEKKVPDNADSGNWVYVKDHDAVEKVYLVTDIPAVAKGTLSFKLFIPGTAATIGIYLRSPDLPKDSDAVVEFKAVEGSGNIYVGAHGQRSKLPVTVNAYSTMDFDIEFEATEAGEAINVYLKEDGQRNLIHRETVPGGGTPQSLMITTDTKTAATEFYVGDLSLVSRT